MIVNASSASQQIPKTFCIRRWDLIGEPLTLLLLATNLHTRWSDSQESSLPPAFTPMIHVPQSGWYIQIIAYNSVPDWLTIDHLTSIQTNWTCEVSSRESADLRTVPVAQPSNFHSPRTHTLVDYGSFSLPYCCCWRKAKTRDEWTESAGRTFFDGVIDGILGLYSARLPRPNLTT